MSRWSKLLTFLILIGCVAPAGIGFGHSETNAAQSGSSWTYMVYMANDYYVQLNWQDDINEMEAAQRAPGLNVIALVDLLGLNNSFILNVTHDPNFLDSTIVSQTIDDRGAVITNEEVNMASPTTLSAFINFSARTYPADHYVLDLWGHGAGWRGLCPDGTSLLTLPGLRRALAQSAPVIGRSLDMVIVDACAEANVETLWSIGGFVDFFVASEKDVPYQGLPYDLVLNDLAANTAQGVDRFGSRIVYDYVAWSVTNSDYSTTLGVFNLTRGYEMYLPSRLMTYYDPIFHDTFQAMLGSSERYENASTIDYGDFLRLMMVCDIPLEIRYAAAEELLFLNRITSHFAMFSNLYATDGISVKNATGLTVYVPSNEAYDDPYNDLTISIPGWGSAGRLLSSTTTTIPNGPAPEVVYHSGPAVSPDMPSSISFSMLPTYGSPSVSAFVNETAGLAQVLGYATSVQGSEIVLSNISGRLSLDLSTSVGPSFTKATSYHRLNVTLYGESAFEIRIAQGAKIVGRDEFVVTLICPAGPKDAYFSNGSYRANLTIPTDAQLGDQVTVEVRDRNAGQVIGSQVSLVSRGSATITVRIMDQRTSQGEVAIPLMFSLLPGLLILGFALMLRNQRRRPA